MRSVLRDTAPRRNEVLWQVRYLDTGSVAAHAQRAWCGVCICRKYSAFGVDPGHIVTVVQSDHATVSTGLGAVIISAGDDRTIRNATGYYFRIRRRS